MARSKYRDEPKQNRIVTLESRTAVRYRGNIIVYKPTKPVLMINPSYLLPCARRIRKDYIVVSGKRRGYACWVESVSRYYWRYKNRKVKLLELLKMLGELTGVHSNEMRRGFILLKIDGKVYHVVKHGENEQKVRHTLYSLALRRVVAYCICTRDYKQVELHEIVSGANPAMAIAMGYVVQHELYTEAVLGVSLDTQLFG